VTSCITVGHNEENNYQRADFDKKTVKPPPDKAILIEKHLALIEGVGTTRWAAAAKWKRKVNPKKVGPFSFLNLFLAFINLLHDVYNLAMFTWDYTVRRIKENNLNVYCFSSKLKNKVKDFLFDLTLDSLLKTSNNIVKLIPELGSKGKRIIQTGLEITKKLYNKKKTLTNRGPKISKKLEGYLGNVIPEATDLLDLTRSKAISDFDHKSSLNQSSFLLKCYKEIWKMVVPIFFISSTIILSLTIDLDLLRQTIEPNPGEMKTNPDLTIVSYNCNGLGDRSKLKRLMTKLNLIVSNGGIVLLQETHIVDTKYLEMIWKHNFVSNGFRTNSAGVIILFHREMKIHDVYKDKNGRTIVAALENDEDKFIVVNSYFPNDHKEAINFAEEVYVKILEYQTMYPNHITFFGGDLNMCSNLNDCLNRNITNSEKLLAAAVDENNDITNLVDA
jgi:hypothetical protein